ncbi:MULTISPECIES: histidine kinase [Bifidobacterium]|uniref:histidine kinase n=1 Tax=Bifidobacterium TaxID=1678 RepID=UPI001BDD5692|nr:MULTISPECIES: histidine kinase [Bifidobacterium]MBT1161102.1 2CS histidine protein kinase [Bifidobacterium sp. SO1]MBW3078176.1 2CS histidine protein kinase [Bifidobacterium simiiventris]
MTEWLERLDDADRRTDNAWLLTAVLVVALVCAGETLGAVTSGVMPAADAACTFAVVAATMLMAFRPVTGAFTVTALWSSLSVAAVDMPSAMLLCLLAAIGILGYAYRRTAVAVTIIALAVWMFTQGGVALPSGNTGTGSSYSSNMDSPSSDSQPDQSNQSSSGNADDPANTATDPNDHVLLGTVAMSGIAPVAVLFAGFLLGGMAARWNHERHSERMELAYRRQRARAAQDIHDYVSNDLAYLILRLDKDIADGKSPGVEELRELRDVASGALDRTHQVIGVIEGRETGQQATAANGRTGATAPSVAPCIDDRPSDHSGASSSFGSHHARRSSGLSVVNPNAERDDCPLAEQLRTIAYAGDHRLKELGFDGQTIITNANDSAEPDDLIAGFLEELYGNIAKHADPAGGYVLTIGIGRDAVQIALVDTALDNTSSHASLSLGTGLDRYRMRVDSRGGVFDINARNDEWTLSVLIPLR